jgi:hypothetical protein
MAELIFVIFGLKNQKEDFDLTALANDLSDLSNCSVGASWRSSELPSGQSLGTLISFIGRGWPRGLLKQPLRSSCRLGCVGSVWRSTSGVLAG